MPHPCAGGMTEEKKSQRRKVLAKWLKENILRLGPTFIKIGQQFSTRVDILPQEYVDQLSELQVKLIYLKIFMLRSNFLVFYPLKYLGLSYERNRILVPKTMNFSQILVFPMNFKFGVKYHKLYISCAISHPNPIQIRYFWLKLIRCV